LGPLPFISACILIGISHQVRQFTYFHGIDRKKRSFSFNTYALFYNVYFSSHLFEKIQNQILSQKGIVLANFAYLRVSKDSQDVENQKYGILDYCNHNKISPVTIVKDTASRTKAWRKRGIARILQKSQKGDKILVAEVSRLGGSPL
jgi:hypothetical protein